jgi:hypothetical protein
MCCLDRWVLNPATLGDFLGPTGAGSSPGYGPPGVDVLPVLNTLDK